MFDLQSDPEELRDRADDRDCAGVLRDMEAELRRIGDPEAVDAMAQADQQASIDRVGGRAGAATMGAGGATRVAMPASLASDSPST